MANKRIKEAGVTYKEMWAMIPIGKENAVAYADLQYLWGIQSKRETRRVLSYMSTHDMGDKYVLIRGSNHKGFYRSNNLHEIEVYFRQTMATVKTMYMQVEKMLQTSSEILEEDSQSMFSDVSVDYLYLIAMKAFESNILSTEDQTSLKS